MAFIWHRSNPNTTVNVPLATSGFVMQQMDGVQITAGGEAQKLVGGSTQTFGGFAACNITGDNGRTVVPLYTEGIIEAEVLGADQSSLLQTVFLFDAASFTFTATNNTPIGVVTEYMGGFNVRIAIQTAFHKPVA